MVRLLRRVSMMLRVVLVLLILLGSMPTVLAADGFGEQSIRIDKNLIVHQTGKVETFEVHIQGRVSCDGEPSFVNDSLHWDRTGSGAGARDHVSLAPKTVPIQWAEERETGDWVVDRRVEVRVEGDLPTTRTIIINATLSWTGGGHYAGCETRPGANEDISLIVLPEDRPATQEASSAGFTDRMSDTWFIWMMLTLVQAAILAAIVIGRRREE